MPMSMDTGMGMGMGMTTDGAAWLSVVGIGEDGLAGLTPSARLLVDQAQVVFGGERHLELLPPGSQDRRPWRMPLSSNRDGLAACRGQRVCVLASGDPLWFGIGSVLIGWFSPDEVTVAPHPGAFSLAAAAMGWALQGCRCLTIHGRPLAALALHAYPSARLLVLSEDAASPAQVAQLLSSLGFSASRITVLEHLGGPRQRRLEGTAGDYRHPPGADLNTLAIEVVADGRHHTLSTCPGLPDDAFLHDGQLTKREVRAATLSALGPWPGALLWDIGAGSGSVAIEWMRQGGEAVAVERDEARLERIARNALALGVPGLRIVAGEAPAALVGLPAAPDAVFIGGGATDRRILAACWAALRSDGRLVANAVTAEGEAALIDWHHEHGGEMVRLAVSRLAPTGRFQCWHPLMPITQYIGTKS